MTRNNQPNLRIHTSVATTFAWMTASLQIPAVAAAILLTDLGLWMCWRNLLGFQTNFLLFTVILFFSLWIGIAAFLLFKEEYRHRRGGT